MTQRTIEPWEDEFREKHKTELINAYIETASDYIIAHSSQDAAKGAVLTITVIHSLMEAAGILAITTLDISPKEVKVIIREALMKIQRLGESKK